MQLNKTFLLVAKDVHTEGSMLIVIDSLDEFVRMFKEYHVKKCDFMKIAEEFNEKLALVPYDEWKDIYDKHRKYENQFIENNNNKPFDFELSTGCHYMNSGKGDFYDDIKITNDPEQNKCWYIFKEFLSDLPTGTHYCGDYSA